MTLIACADATAPAFPADAPPAAFSVGWWGFGYGTHTVTLKGDTLVVVRRSELGLGDTSRTSRLVPGRADWAAFWRAADAAGVRAWASKCQNENIMDGSAFEVEIAYEGGTISSSGGNAYPRRDGTCRLDGQTSDEMVAFLRAVSALIRQPYP